MKLIDLLIEDEEIIDVDKLMKKGFLQGPETIDPETGSVKTQVYNVADFKKFAKSLRDVKKNLDIYKHSSNKGIADLSQKITKELNLAIKDILDLEGKVYIFKSTL